MDPLQILGYLKLPTKVLAGIALAAIGILFLPADWIGAVGLTDVRTTYRWFLGLVILISTALLVVEGVVAAFGAASRRATRHRAASEQRQVEASRLQAQERTEAQERERQTREETEKLAARLKFLQDMTDAEREQCCKFISNAKRTVWLTRKMALSLSWFAAMLFFARLALRTTIRALKQWEPTSR